MEQEARNIELGRIAIELRYLDQGKVREILREANRRQASFVEMARALEVLDESACRVLESYGQTPARPKSSHSGQVQLPQVGSEIEGYQLTALIGKGGMGAVFKAEKAGLNGEKQIVALKFILTAEARALERFEREAQAVAAVDRHPNIVSIKSYLRWQGLPCLVFDYVEGEGLDDLMGRQTLTLRQSTKIVETIASALQYSHEKEILHRDLKPANVLIRKDDGQVFLTDFGLARLSGASALTGSQDMLGTPHYMSPEQAGSEHERLGPSTDIWALGVIYYELVTGKKPFEGESAVELITKIMFTEPRRPSALNDDLPKTVDAVILKALRKDPGQRYGTAREFLDDCQRVLLGESVQASAVASFPQRISGLYRRYGRWVVGGIILTVVVLALSMSVWWHSHIINKNRRSYQSRVQKELSLFKANEENFQRYKAVVLIESLLGGADSGKLSPATKILASNFKSIEKLRRLKEEGTLSGFEAAFFETVSKQKWRELSDYSLLCRGLDGEASSTTWTLSKPWKSWLEGALALKAKDVSLAVKKFESASSGTGELVALSYFGIDLAESKRNDWSSAVFALEASFERIDKRQNIFQRRVLEVLRDCREESYLAVLLSLGDKDRLTRVEEKLRALSPMDWKRVNEKLSQRFEKLSETKLKQSVLVYRQLKSCARFNSNLQCPEPSVKLHLELAAQARRTGDIAQALYHELRLQKLDPDSKQGVLSNADLRQLILDAGFFKRNLEKAYLITLAVSRAGIYVPYLRDDWCEALEKTGVFDREVNKNPSDPYPRFWRALVPIHPISASRVATKLKDIKFVLKSQSCREQFKAVMLRRRAELHRRLAKSLDSSESARIVSLLEDAMEDVSRALKMIHPAPDRLYNEMCLLYEEYPAAVSTPDLIKRWLRAAELWRGEIEKRYRRTVANTLTDGRDADSPLLPMTYSIQQRTLSFAYRSRSAAYRRGKQFDKALEFAKRVNRHATAKMNNKVALFVIKEILLCYIESGRDKEAKAVFEECVKDGRSLKELRVLRGLWRENPPALPVKKE
ncbi:MAG: serine/threonine-protein kinase [Planctomycetota bacterium]|nr:serine/threonine-protein kinase [Planctomycetota bacterium]